MTEESVKIQFAQVLNLCYTAPVMSEDKVIMQPICEDALRRLVMILLELTGADDNVFAPFNATSFLKNILSDFANSNYHKCRTISKNIPENCEYVFIHSKKSPAVCLWTKHGDKYKYFYSVNSKYALDFAKELEIDKFSVKNILPPDETINRISHDKNSKKDFDTAKVRYIAHEIKNQLSICDLYSEIIKKCCIKNNINDKTIQNSAECIINAAKMAGNSLLELKSANSHLAFYNISDIVSKACSLAQVYGKNKKIKIFLDAACQAEIYADKDKLISVIINLIKNACEAFDDNSTKDKNITTAVRQTDKSVKILISNNAKPVENTDLIFKEGYTEKTSGSGLGLCICKKNIEEMSGTLELVKSDRDLTVFEITMPKIRKNS